MAIEFRNKPERVEDFAYDIEAIGERADELYPVMSEIADLVLDREKRMFESRGATSGVYWTPLKGSTIKKKQALKVPHVYDPLRRFGDLEESLTRKWAPFQRLEINDDSFYLETTVPYAHFHAEGTRRMPKPRPPLVIPKKHAIEYVKMVNDYIFGLEARGE